MAAEHLYVPNWDVDSLRAAARASGIGLWRWNVDTDEITLDRQSYELWGLDEGIVLTFETLSAKIHPSDIDRVRAGFHATRALIGPYEIDFRIILDGAIRWISTRGQGSDADILHHAMRGIFLDVTGRKQAEEAHELLAGEMSHRVKNLLQVAVQLARFTSRSAATTQDMVRDLTSRLNALGRAHDLVRPRGGRPVAATLLGDLLTVLLQAYDDTDGSIGRIRIAVPRLDIGEVSSTTIALVVHELATNSLKHGALSVEAGTLDVTCMIGTDEVMLVWTERGGPLVAAPRQGDPGFGSELIRRLTARQLGGGIDIDWSAAGVIVRVRMQRNLLAA